MDAFEFNATDTVDGTIQAASQGTRIFASIVTILIIISGVLGNSLTVAALIKCPKIRNATSAFIFSLCVADTTFCVLVMPFSVHRFLAGSDAELADGSVWCVLQPLIRYANVGVSLLSIAMIAINRYIMIAHQPLYKRVYTPKGVMAMVAFIWIFSHAILIPTLAGKWGEFGFDDRLQTCTIIRVEGRSSKTALFILGFLIPCITIVISYLSIFWTVRRSENRMRKHSAADAAATAAAAAAGRRPGRTGSDWRVTKMVLVIFVTFVVCYLPITIIKIVDKRAMHPDLHLLSNVLIYLSACTNPITYVVMNRQYRTAFRAVLCPTCGADAAHSSSSSKPAAAGAADKTGGHSRRAAALTLKSISASQS